MSSREVLSLPPDCALRADFPDGNISVRLTGVESHEGPAHVHLYDAGTPQTPVMHLTLEAGSDGAVQVEQALATEHNDYQLDDSAIYCVALDSLGVVMRHRRQPEAA